MTDMKAADLSLRQLRTFGAMLKEPSLTQVAYSLNTTQPNVSKTLARLRAYFRDPLFVRVGTRMHPTPRALQVAEAVRGLLELSEELASPAEAFRPGSSQREFRLLLTDVGMIHLLPPILHRVEESAPSARLVVLDMDSRQLENKLESGDADVAIGAFSRASHGLRRQWLYSDYYVGVARRQHPRLEQLRSRAGFVGERHVVIRPSTSGHAVHEVGAQASEEQIPTDRICLRVPSFAAVAAVVMQTDAIGTMPAQLAATLAPKLGLVTFPTPYPTPAVEIAQFWHERYQRDPGHKWLRACIADLFRDARRGSRSAT